MKVTEGNYCLIFQLHKKDMIAIHQALKNIVINNRPSKQVKEMYERINDYLFFNGSDNLKSSIGIEKIGNSELLKRSKGLKVKK